MRKLRMRGEMPVSRRTRERWCRKARMSRKTDSTSKAMYNVYLLYGLVEGNPQAQGLCDEAHEPRHQNAVLEGCVCLTPHERIELRVGEMARHVPSELSELVGHHESDGKKQKVYKELPVLK
jgi:hypothetical protein